MTRKIFLFLFLFLNLSFQQVAAQKTILWSVTSPASAKTSFLLGTFHQMGNSFVDSLPQIKEALLQSEVAIFESVDNSEKLVTLLNSRNEDLTFQEYLKKDDAAFLKSFSAGWAVPVSKLSPMELLVKLQQEYAKANCGTIKPTDTWSHFDKYLIHLATSQNLAVVGLETDSLQTNYINAAQTGFTWQQAKKPLQEWIRNIKKSRDTGKYCRVAQDYLKFDLDYKFSEKCGDNVMLKGRNEKWLPKILPYLENQNAFVAVGLLHLYGDCGLIMQLKAKGYLVTPVILTSN